MKNKDKNNQVAPKEQRIIYAAQDVFARRGFERATLDEIIAIADVGKGTVYKYYGSKEQLFYKLVEEKNQTLVQDLEKAVAAHTDFNEQLLAYFTELVSFYRTNASLWQIVLFEMSDVAHGCLIKYHGEEIEVTSQFPDVSEATKELVQRYARLVYNEVKILINLLEKGKREGLIRAVDPVLSAKFFFFGVAITIIRQDVMFSDASIQEVAERIVEGYLHGDAV